MRLRLSLLDIQQTRLPPLLVAASAQLAAMALMGSLLLMLPRGSISLNAALVLQSLCATGLSFLLRMRAWCLALQAFFVPALYFASLANLAPGWYFAGFVLLFLVYGKLYSRRVPLYLSRPLVWQAVSTLLPRDRSLRVIDLGCGLGGLVAHLADARQGASVYGVEAAPLPFLVAKMRNWARPNTKLIWGDFWRRDLKEFEVVFAYLSPLAMPALWDKAQREMRPGSVFISYRFDIPGVSPSEEIVLADLARTRLYIWRM